MPLSYTKLASQVWRDYIVDGVPTSGKFRPIKSEIRTWGTELQDHLDDVNDAAIALDTRMDTAETDITAAEGAITTIQGDIVTIEADIVALEAADVVLGEKVLPPGSVIFLARSTIPAGFRLLKANGAAVSRTTYAALFAAIGTTFGAGDGVTTFNLPDLRGEFPRGWDDGRGVDSGRVFGSAQGGMILNHTHSGTTSSDGAHTHTYDRFSNGAGLNLQGGGSLGDNTSTATGSAGSHTHTMTTGNPNSGGGAENRPRNIALLGVIAY